MRSVRFFVVAGAASLLSSMASAADLADAFALTGFFLDRHAFAPRGLAVPDARARFLAAVLVRNA